MGGRESGRQGEREGGRQGMSGRESEWEGERLYQWPPFIFPKQ